MVAFLRTRKPCAPWCARGTHPEIAETLNELEKLASMQDHDPDAGRWLLRVAEIYRSVYGGLMFTWSKSTMVALKKCCVRWGAASQKHSARTTSIREAHGLGWGATYCGRTVSRGEDGDAANSNAHRRNLSLLWFNNDESSADPRNRTASRVFPSPRFHRQAYSAAGSRVGARACRSVRDGARRARSCR